jgi:hypothetical protein
MAEYTSEMIGSGQSGVCAHCKKLPTKEGHDGCLGTLPGSIMNACCGHGDNSQAYIQYWDRNIIRGECAVSEQADLININKAIKHNIQLESWKAATKQAAEKIKDLEFEYSELDFEKEALDNGLALAESQIESLQAKIEKLDQHNADMIDASGQECACGYDNPDDVCMGHYGNFKRLQAEIEQLKSDNLIHKRVLVKAWDAVCEADYEGYNSELYDFMQTFEPPAD